MIFKDLMPSETLYLVEALILKRFPREKNSSFFYLVKKNLAVEAGDLVKVSWRKNYLPAIIVKKGYFSSKFLKLTADGASVDFRKISLKKYGFYSTNPQRIVKVKFIDQIVTKNFIEHGFLLNLKKIAEDHFVSWNHLVLLASRMPIKIRRSDFSSSIKIKNWIRPPVNCSKDFGNIKFAVKKLDHFIRKEYVFVHYDQTKELVSIIKMILKEGGQILILSPNKFGIYPLAGKYAFLTKDFAADSIIPIDPSAPPFWLDQAWNLSRLPVGRVFVGTRSAIFAPFKNLKLIVLENGDSDNYKQWDLNPRFDLRKIIPHLYPKAIKIYLSNSPRVEDFARSAKVLGVKNNVLQIQNYRVTEASVCSEKADQNIDGSHYRVVRQLKYRGRNKKIILIDAEIENRLFNRKSLLGPNFLKELSRTDSSDSCKIIFGPVNFLNKITEDVFNQIGSKPKEILFLPAIKSETDLEKLRNFFQVQESKIKILLAGFSLLPFINIMRQTKIVAFMPNIDQFLFASDFCSEEKAVRRLFDCLSFAEKIFIRTKTINHKIFQILKKGQYLAFFPDWLQQRKKFGYPPDFLLFKLIATDLKAVTAKKKANDLAKILSKWPTVKDAISSLEPEKKGRRGVYWSVIVRANQDFSFEKLRKILPVGFFFDPDPETLK